MTLEAKNRDRLVAITFDEESIGRGTPDQEHERAIAVYDLIEENSFALAGHDSGPYKLHIALHESKLALNILDETGHRIIVHILSLSPFRRIVKDYFRVCESYFAAVRTATPAQIEAIDMGRRGLHNEGAQVLMERLRGKADVDFDTSRRLFTLVAALHWKG
jgi:uncharacterized protein (UPF0262 family)